MGIVYLAILQGPGGFNKLVVVKELKPELVEEPAFLRMFLDEARLAARLNHPNIVQTNEVGNDGNRYFMAMDYLDGRAFDRVRRRSYNSGAILSLPLQLRVLADVLSGLDYAHRLTDFDGSPLNLVHRDVSPSNVFLTFEGQVKLLDFGIAKTADSSHETRVGVLKGKLSYMAPEQARGERVDARADTFAVGVMLWEALTSRRLRNTQNDYELLRSLTVAEMPRASSVNPAVPAELDVICARALGMQREDRYSSAAEFRAELERFMAGSGMSPVHRDLGAVVADMFADERVATNALIEAHVARARTGADRAELPIIHAGAQSALGMTPSGEPQWPAWDAGSSPVPNAPTLRSEQRAAASPGGAPGAGRTLSAPGTQVGASSVLAPRRSFVIPAAAISVLAVAAFVYIAFFLPGRQQGAAGSVGSGAASVAQGQAAGQTTDRTVDQAAGQTTDQTVDRTVDQATDQTGQPTESPPSASELSASAAQAQDLVEVEVRVTPAEASVTIDGALVTGNPFRGKFVRAEVIRQVRAESPGYLPKTRALAFSSNVKLDLSLERRPRPTPPPPLAASARHSPPRAAEVVRQSDPPPSAPPADVNPAGGTKPRRPIDSSNPYGTDP